VRAFFAPTGCAVIGASRDPAKPGHQILRSLLDAGFPPGRLFPVNPGESEVAGLPAYPDLVSIPAPVELAVLMVPPRALDTVLADVKARAVGRGDLKAVIVTAGGFAELGTVEGRERQARLVAAVRDSGVRLIGPNCVGVIDTETHVDTTFLHGVVRRPGPIAFVSQSGAVGAWFAQMLSSEPEPVGFSKLISLGNMADVSLPEVLDFLRTDPATKVVGLYLEGTSRPRALLGSIAALSVDKPVVVMKTGRSDSGREAATSHTGALAGSDRIWEGALRQVGALRAETMDGFVDTLRLLAAGVRAPARSPLRVFLVTHAGGPGVYALDLLAAHPSELRPAGIEAGTRAAVAAAVPPLSSVCRPEGHVDMTASATPAQHTEVSRLLLEDPGVDALVTLDLPIRFLPEEAIAEALTRAWSEVGGARAGKVFLPLLMHGKWSASGRAILERAGLSPLGSPDRVVAALVSLARLGELGRLASREDLGPDNPGSDPPGATPGEPPGDPPGATPAGVTLSEWESMALLRPVLEGAEVAAAFPASRLARSKEEALAAAREVGYPVVLKLCSRAIPHKAAVGGVRLGLRSPDDFGRAYDELAARAGELLGSDTTERLEGFLVQAQVEPGPEVIVGALRDPLFGPVVAAGLGGTRVGADSPLHFRLAPLSERGACGLAEEATGVETLGRFILAVSRLMLSRPDIAEVDLNPIVVASDGRGALAVDALVRLA
jgi:acyl-CoA synthetase (NDP forming)